MKPKEKQRLRDWIAAGCPEWWTTKDGQSMQSVGEVHVRRCMEEIERLTELNDKYIWQVRDTCKRAEEAEARIRKAMRLTLFDRKLIKEAEPGHYALVPLKEGG